MRILAFALSLPLLFITGVSQAETFTGCLKTNGSITNVAIGEAPKAPCGGDSLQISWNSGGPQGAPGPQGPQGPTGPAGPPGLDAPTYIFAGFSDVPVTGSAGLVGLYNACQSKFGPDSRMCTSREILNSTTLSQQTGEAWVHPVFVGITDFGSSASLVADVSGLGFSVGAASRASEELSCRGWTGSIGVRGLTVNGSLGFGSTRCDLPIPVACCSLQ